MIVRKNQGVKLDGENVIARIIFDLRNIDQDF